VPIVDTRLKKSPVRPTPEEQLEMNKLPFRNLLGGVGYLVTATMPSIAYAYKEIARFSSSFNHEHWRALLELIAYVKNHPIPLVLSLYRRLQGRNCTHIAMQIGTIVVNICPLQAML
jgi:hypothetical protein